MNADERFHATRAPDGSWVLTHDGQSETFTSEAEVRRRICGSGFRPHPNLAWIWAQYGWAPALLAFGIIVLVLPPVFLASLTWAQSRRTAAWPRTRR